MRCLVSTFIRTILYLAPSFIIPPRPSFRSRATVSVMAPILTAKGKAALEEMTKLRKGGWHE